ncbi:DNA-binding NarL/FixJ family response regulator [Arthrobacter sp. CAN_A214]
MGRNDLVDELLGSVKERTSSGAIVYGPIGMGKSALARHLAGTVQDFGVPFLLHAGAGMANVPYGALTPWLANASAADMGSSVSVLRALVLYFRTRSAGRPVVIIVDDAHALDPDSSHLLAQLVTAGTVKLLAFARKVPGRSEELSSLSEDGLLSRFELQSLPFEDVRKVCEIGLGGRISQGACAYFMGESEGNPLFLRSLLEHAVRTEALAFSDGTWVLIAKPDGLDPGLSDLVASVVRQLPEAQSDILGAVALAGKLPMTDLSALGGDDDVRALLASGLLLPLPTEHSLVACHPPLYGRIVRTLVPAARSASLRERVTSVGRGLPAFGKGRIRHLHWALDCGATVDDPVLLDAAHVATSRSDPESGMRFAGAVQGGGSMPAAAVETARAQFLLGQPVLMEASVFSLMETAKDPETLSAAAILAARVTFAVHGTAEDVHAAVRRMNQLLTTRFDNPADAMKSVGYARSEAQLLSCFALNLEGRYVEAEDILRRLLESTTPDAKLTVLACAILGEALGATGRGTEGRKLTARALGMIGRAPYALAELQSLTLTRHLSLLIHTGEFAEAEAVLRGHQDDEGDSLFYSAGTLSAFEAILEVRRGRFHGASPLLSTAIATLRLSDRDVVLPYVLAVASWAAAAVGQEARSRSLAEEFTGLSHTGALAFSLIGKAHVAAAFVLLEPTVEHLAHLADLAGTARKRGMWACEKDILEMSLLCGDERHVGRLAQLTSSFEGIEAEVLSEYAQAVLTKNPARMEHAGDLAENSQKQSLSVDAAARALRLYAASGDHSAQRGVLRALRRRTGLMERANGLIGGSSDQVRDLTAREREIALLAVNGESNRAIADRLTVSARTVEGHLYRIYSKLGISRREELATVFEAPSDARTNAQ